MSDGLLNSDELVARLRYMARQYTAGQYSRGGNPQGVHYLDQAANEITALRAENARLAQWTDNAQERVFQCLEKVDALRAALDQERADNDRLRAFALAAITDPDDVSEAWSLVVVMKQHGLLDDNAHPTALLLGRGEGGR